MRNCLQQRMSLAVSVSLFAFIFSAFPAASSQQAQNPARKPPAGKTQKVQNPLNDLLDEAQTALDKNNFEAAITPLQKFLAEKPDVAFAHFQLAYAYTGLNRVDEARAEYERCVALDPKMAEAQLNLGILLLEKDAAAAAPPLRKAVALMASQSRPRFLLGIALERSGDLAGAAESYEAAAHLNPSDTEVQTHLGEMYLQLKRSADAEKRFRAVLESQPNSALALRGLALSLDAEGKPDALEAYRNYLASDPKDSAVRTRFVQLLVANKQFDEALAETDKP